MDRCSIYSIIITWQSNPPISQFNSPCREKNLSVCLSVKWLTALYILTSNKCRLTVKPFIIATSPFFAPENTINYNTLYSHYSKETLKIPIYYFVSCLYLICWCLFCPAWFLSMAPLYYCLVIKSYSKSVNETRILVWIGHRAEFHNNLIWLKFNPNYFMHNYTYFRQIYQEC